MSKKPAAELNRVLLQKYEQLKKYLQNIQGQGICIAYSGGVDSTLLLKTAADCSPSPVLAIVASTQLHPRSDTEKAMALARTLGARCEVLSVDEFQVPELLRNPVNRCYLCKRLLFSELKEMAASRHFHVVIDGTNKDDEKEYRPGMKALKELQIKSPLLDLGFTKQEVRQLSAMLQLPTASAPSAPCMATRLPYGACLDRKLLNRIHEGEVFLQNLGFYNVRLRYHEPVLRLELDNDSFEMLLKQKDSVIRTLKSLGFPYITLDLEGFRSGSMDIGLRSGR